MRSWKPFGRKRRNFSRSEVRSEIGRVAIDYARDGGAVYDSLKVN